MKPICILCSTALLLAIMGAVCPAGDPNAASLRAGASCNRFALDLYAKLRQNTSGNLLFAPTSIWTALAMTSTGARGATYAEMAAVLHVQPDRAQAVRAFSTITAKLSSANTSGSQLLIANRLWAQRGAPFRPEFLQTIREAFRAELGQVDFATRAPEARSAINSWVKQQTAGHIDQLLPETAIDPLTRLVLVNAVYFRGSWAKQFDKAVTHDAVFFVAPNEQVDVQMMTQTGTFRYAELPQLQYLEMPYSGGGLVAAVLLPRKRFGLDAVEQHLSAKALDAFSQQARPVSVVVFLPRFVVSSGFRLDAALEAMGIVSAFDERRADFSGMAAVKEADYYLSAVFHKAYMRVNEEGTEAAAATGATIRARGMVLAPPKPVFRADHPFLFLIRHAETGSVLFVARVANPAAQPGSGDPPGKRPEKH